MSEPRPAQETNLHNPQTSAGRGTITATCGHVLTEVDNGGNGYPVEVLDGCERWFGTLCRSCRRWYRAQGLIVDDMTPGRG